MKWRELQKLGYSVKRTPPDREGKSASVVFDPNGHAIAELRQHTTDEEMRTELRKFAEGIK
jgi:hypothetical protein